MKINPQEVKHTIPRMPPLKADNAGAMIPARL